MRTIMLVAFMAIVTGLKAQTYFPGIFMNNSYRGSFVDNLHDSSYNSKWSFSRYSAISTSYTFFKGGSAAIISAPIGLQLNRRLNNNLFAFANVSLAPAYVNFNRSFITSDFNKGNQNPNFFKTGGLNMYSRAALGLQYVNDDRTFSISGSIGIERSSYPFIPSNQTNSSRTNNHFLPAN